MDAPSILCVQTHEAICPVTLRRLGRPILSLAALLLPVSVSASPTEQEYIELLRGSVTTYGGTAQEAMRHVIDGADRNDAADQFRLGTALMRIKHHFAAIEVLTRATELAPGNATAFATLGISYYATGNCDKAVPAFAKAVELDPAGPRAGDSSRRIGSCLIYGKDYAGAEKRCAEAGRLLPSDPAPRLCLGHAQFGQARYAESLSTYLVAYRLSSGAYPPFPAEARSGVLANLAKLNRLGEAADTLKLAPASTYTPQFIERLAANAVSKLELGEKPQW